MSHVQATGVCSFFLGGGHNLWAEAPTGFVLERSPKHRSPTLSWLDDGSILVGSRKLQSLGRFGPFLFAAMDERVTVFR